MKNSGLSLVLLAAGSSTRMGTGKKKEYMGLGSGTVLSASLKAFFKYENESAKKYGTERKFSRIIITVPCGQESEAEKALESDPEINTPELSRLTFISGGKTRQESVCKALRKLDSECMHDESMVVLIHDSARPFVSTEIIADVIDGTEKSGAAVPAVPSVDTLKDNSGTTSITAHLVRKNIVAVQTPQGFLLKPLLLCHEKASLDGKEYTDDSEIWDSFPELTGGKKVLLTKGGTFNKKITYKEDIPSPENQMIRIGFGTDLHVLVEGRKFMLGGVEIPSQKGEAGHSDGDVLLHAISDAVLGASGLGDIGSYFPPEDPKWKDSDSSLLLKKIWSDVKNAGWELENMDCVLEFESPKFIPWREKVIESIAGILGVEKDRIFVKAKTNEKLDSVGMGRAIKAYCACLLKK